MPVERRQLNDRRRRPTSPFSRHSVFGRRRNHRRLAERKNYYVDRYEFRYLVLILAILILCLLDVYFTLKILLQGGVEMNPIMAFLLQKKPLLSLVLKYLITAGSLVFLLVHKNFKIFGRVKGHFLIYAVFGLYLLLMIYEMTILFSHLKI